MLTSLCCFAPVEEDGKMSSRTLVCVIQVKQGMQERWKENMPLPGDIIEGVAGEEGEECFLPTRARSDLSTQLGRLMNKKHLEVVWVKVRRWDGTLNLRARVVQERTVPRRFTIRALSDERHVAVLGDLTLDQCAELQEMSRNVVNVVVDQGPGFRRKGVKYDWRRKVGTHLPDPQSSVISSILFKPLPSGEEEEEEEEGGMEATTRRSMAWFSAAIASGVPLIFVNIQTEQIVSSCSPERRGSPPPISRSRSRSRGKPQISNTGVQLLRGIRLWFLPGESEIPLFLSPQPGEIRFGMDIKRTEEGFICISGAAKGLAAERAGVGQMREEAAAAGQLLVISRLDGKSLIPSTVCSAGLIHCCDHSDVKATLAVSIERMDGIQLHLMRWPTQQQHQAAAPSTTTTTATTTPNHNNIQAMAIALTALRPPPSLSSSSSIESHPTCNATHSIQWSHDDSESYNDLTKNPPADPSSPFDAQDSFYHWDA